MKPWHLRDLRWGKGPGAKMEKWLEVAKLRLRYMGTGAFYYTPKDLTDEERSEYHNRRNAWDRQQPRHGKGHE